MLGKERIKSVIYGYEVRTTAIISNGLVHRVPKQQILKRIKNELDKVTKYANLTDVERNHLWNETYSRYIMVSKQSFSSLRKSKNPDLDYDEELKLRKNVVYGVVKSEFRRLEKDKNELANEYEYRGKREMLTEQFDSGIFYLCSSHIKPAKDHADWEGKIYVSEDWAERVAPEFHSQVAAYIRNHNVRTVEWVTGEPVWMVYRPNCKHYFVEVSVEEVLGNSVRKLLKKHNMYMADEKELSYESCQYKNYYERLKMLTYLKSMFDAEELDKDITETRKLVRKWKLLSEGSGYRINRAYRASTSREAA